MSWVVVEMRELEFYPSVKVYGPFSSSSQAEARRRERHFDMTSGQGFEQIQLRSFKTFVAEVEEMPR